MPILVPEYKIAVESFLYKNEIYNLAISPELYPDSEGLDFTGGYKGLLIHPVKGTILFTFSPDDNYTSEQPSWNVLPAATIDPNVIDEILKIISKIKDGTARQF